jgi:hypothetical protein
VWDCLGAKQHICYLQLPLTAPLPRLCKGFHSPLTRNINPEDGSGNICRNIWKPSTLYTAYSQKLKLNKIVTWYMALPVSHQLPNIEALVQSQGRSCGICGGQSDTGAGFLRQFSFHQLLYIHLSFGAGAIGRLVTDSTKWTQSQPHPTKLKKKKKWGEASFSLHSCGINPRRLHVRFIVDKITLEQKFLWFSPANYPSTIALLHHPLTRLTL